MVWLWHSNYSSSNSICTFLWWVEACAEWTWFYSYLPVYCWINSTLTVTSTQLTTDVVYCWNTPDFWTTLDSIQLWYWVTCLSGLFSIWSQRWLTGQWVTSPVTAEETFRVVFQGLLVKEVPFANYSQVWNIPVYAACWRTR
jgi:hypothetical protein